MLLVLCAVLCFFVCLSHAQPNNNNYLVPQWQSGDVRLVNGTSPSNGVVQLYLDLKNGTAGWASVCNQIASALTAATICRQLGYYVTNPPNPGRGPINNNAVWLISDWECNGAYSHILQCVTWTNINSNPFNPPPECTNHDMTIDCGSSPQSAYLGNSSKDVQLYRDSGYTRISSFGALRVYLPIAPNEGWGFVTNDIFKSNPFTMAAANAACRQLGYTGAVNYGRNMTMNSETQLTWFGGSKCTNQWYSCFSCCFDVPAAICGQSCDVSTAVFLQCTFDLASIGANTQITCSNETPESCAQSDVIKSEANEIEKYKVGFGVGVGVGVPIVILLTVSVLLFFICGIPAIRRHQGYLPIDRTVPT